MRTSSSLLAITLALAASSAPESLLAQTAAEASDGATAEAPAQPAGDLMTDAELQTLVAPVALYPDTLLIQILVGATQPFDLMKADRLLLENEGAETAALEEVVKAEGYDPSVEVLALAFPDVLHGMADHIDWSETVGDAMLAQSDDVMDAVQVMRDQAIQTGALVTTEQQTVETDPETEVVVIQPADPEVVYVPQYDPQAVYDPSFSTGDAVTAGLITWGVVTVIDEIFDDDDDWNDYWGCRNCGGWGGGPIIRDPDIDIDVDGNVNIGNIVGSGNVGDRLDGEGNIIDRDRPTTLPGWTPDNDRAEDARSKIENARGDGGATNLPINRPDSSDALREKLSSQTGAADITRPEGRPALRDAAGAAAAGGAAGAIAGSQARDRVGSGDGNRAEKIKAKSPEKRPAVKKPAAKAKPAVNRPAAQAKRPAAQAKRPSPKIAKKSSGHRSKAAGSRGKAKARGKGRRR